MSYCARSVNRMLAVMNCAAQIVLDGSNMLAVTSEHLWQPVCGQFSCEYPF